MESFQEKKKKEAVDEENRNESFHCWELMIIGIATWTIAIVHYSAERHHDVSDVGM